MAEPELLVLLPTNPVGWRQRVASQLAGSSLGRQPHWRLRLRDLGSAESGVPLRVKRRPSRGTVSTRRSSRADPVVSPPAPHIDPLPAAAEAPLSFTPTFARTPAASSDGRPARRVPEPVSVTRVSTVGGSERSATSGSARSSSSSSSSAPASTTTASSTSSASPQSELPSPAGSAPAGICFACGAALAATKFCPQTGLPHAPQSASPSPSPSPSPPPPEPPAPEADPPPPGPAAQQQAAQPLGPPKEGDRVRAHGLKNKVALNGQAGTLTAFVEKRGDLYAHVDFGEPFGKVTMHPKNLHHESAPPPDPAPDDPAPPRADASTAALPAPAQVQDSTPPVDVFTVGARVTACGLQRRGDLNGLTGVVRSTKEGPDGEKLAVVAFEGKDGNIALREKNLQLERAPAAPPPDPSAPLEDRYPVGSTVRAANLVKRADLNGLEGTVKGHQPGPGGEGLVKVYFPSVDEQLALRQKNVELPGAAAPAPATPAPLGVGDEVVAKGLIRNAQLNGLTGTIVEVLDGGVMDVEFAEPHGRVKVRTANLARPHEAAAAVQVSASTPGQPPPRKSAFKPGQRVISLGMNCVAPGGCRGTYLRYVGDGVGVVRFGSPHCKDEPVKEICIRSAPDLPRFQDGDAVEARGLAAGLDGARGEVSKCAETRGGVAWVDFGKPHGQLAVKERNLQSAVGVGFKDPAGVRVRFSPHPDGGLCYEYNQELQPPFQRAKMVRKPDGVFIATPENGAGAGVLVPKGGDAVRLLSAIARLFTAFGVAHDLPAPPPPSSFPPGSPVRAQGLTANRKLNGQKGVVVSHHLVDGGKTALVSVRFAQPVGTMTLRLDNVVLERG
eukprot:TRINITY_DN12321_c0_g2_i1.p1 TRINITY_DN12321_c0_g2~~TRINITY_DN12321_c0_g2_i1.p1  ORF type:complete len:857 (+),score=248.32 TRINITY_DN12321_c0_g2_i1:54-2573(+)